MPPSSPDVSLENRVATGAVTSPQPVLEEITAASSRKGRAPRFLRRLAGPVLLLIVWQVVCSADLISANVLVGPITTASAGWTLISDGRLPAAVGASVQRVAIGSAIGVSVGLVLALLAGLYRLGEELIDSTVQMLRTVPFVGLTSLLLAWFGIGEAPKYALIAIGTAFPVYLNVYAGIRSVDLALVEVAEVLRVARSKMILQVVLPAALPSFFVGLRYSLAVSWIALVFVEQVNTVTGLGALMNQAQTFGQIDVVIVCLAVYALLGIAIDLVIRLLERWTLAWRPTFEGR